MAGAEIPFKSDVARTFSGVSRHPEMFPEGNDTQRVVMFLTRSKSGAAVMTGKG